MKESQANSRFKLNVIAAMVLAGTGAAGGKLLKEASA